MGKSIRAVVRLTVGALAVPALCLAAFPASEVYLPMVGRNPGVYPSQWYTTVWVYNPNAETADVTFALLERDKANTAPVTFADVLQPGETRKYENAVQTLFGKSAWGAIRVTSAHRVVVNERLYDQPAGAGQASTAGQSFAGVPKELAIGLGESTELLGVYQTQPAADSEFRFNYGFVETTGRPVTVRVTARSPSGTSLGQRDHSLLASSQRQFAVASSFPTVSTENARLTVEVISGDGEVIAYGTGIANGSQDPTTFEMATAWPAIAHDATLTGDGAASSPLGVAPGSLTAASLAPGAVTGEKIAAGAVGLAHLGTSNAPAATGAAVHATAIGAPPVQVLSSDGVGLVWSAINPGGLTGVVACDGLTGGGSSGDVPLYVGAGPGIAVYPDAVGIATGGVVAPMLASGAVTKEKLAASGGTAGQILTTDGTGLSWSIPVGGLDLPYYGIMTGSGQPAFEILDSGGGTSIRATTSSLTAPTLEVIQQNAHGTAIHAVKTVGSNPGEAGGITILAENNTAAGTAIVGTHAGEGAGVVGTGRIGVKGNDTGNDDFSAGVVGNSSAGTGVAGYSGSGEGVRAWSDTGTALAAKAETSAIALRAEGKTNTAVWATTESGFAAVHGASPAGGLGIYGESATGIAVRAVAHTDTAVYATTDSGLAAVHASAEGGFAVRAEAQTSTSVFATTGSGFAAIDARNGSGIGLYVTSDSQDAVSAHASAADRSGIYATNPNSDGWAGYFDGMVGVTGWLQKAGGGFTIDHPLEPDGKYLQHSFVESPDMKNVYDGVITTDDDGLAIVELPAWFEALNRDFRYQLTVIGRFAQAIVEQEVEGNSFAIRTNLANVKVSWQITGIRQDRWAEAHRMPVEKDKPRHEHGLFLHPELFGAPPEAGVARSHRAAPPQPQPEAMAAAAGDGR